MTAAGWNDPTGAKNGGMLVCGMVAIVVLYATLSGPPGSAETPNNKAKFGDRQMVDFPAAKAIATAPVVSKHSASGSKHVIREAPATTAAATDRRLELISATATTPGNLGPPTVILSDAVGDWLKDRWQATPPGNMQGKPLKLPQWITAQLATPATSLSSVLVDMETGFADGYEVQTASSPDGPWTTQIVVSGGSAATDGRGNPVEIAVSKSHRHVVNTLTFSAGAGAVGPPFTYVRLRFTHLATGFGVSVWRLVVNGH